MKRSLLPATMAIVFAFATSMMAQEEKDADASKLTEQDHVRIAVQEICPVSGKELGSMGAPVKVKIGEEQAYLCCQGCVGQDVNAEHWKAIQANFAKAQGNCPIMGKPVDATMKSTVVDGQRIYVCCPPCIEKIQADKEAALAKLHTSYKKAAMDSMQETNDEMQIAAQGICPVSGKELGSMGKPVKVRVGENETAFLCCKGCVGQKIDPELWAKAQENLAAAQGTCPVMGKPVDASMKSTVINGRKVFVCCPPCIEKIEAEPVMYMAKVNAQVKKNTASKK